MQEQTQQQLLSELEKDLVKQKKDKEKARGILHPYDQGKIEGRIQAIELFILRLQSITTNRSSLDPKIK